MIMMIIMTTMMMLSGTYTLVAPEHDGFLSCGLRDLKVASRTSRATLLALQVSAEQSVDNDNDDNYNDDDDAFLGLTHF